MRDKLLPVLAIFTVLAISMVIYHFADQGRRGSIDTWANENQCRVLECEQTVFDHGPFWFVGEDDVIYRVRLLDPHENERVSYFKFSLWGMEQAWKD